METKKHCNPFLRYSFYHFPSNDNYLLNLPFITVLQYWWAF